MIRKIIVSMEKGKLKCKPSSKGANPGDIIRWESDIPFAIHFMKHSPLEKLSFTSLGSGGVHLVDSKVLYDHKSNGPIRSEYVVAAYDKKATRGEKFGIIDPDLVIPPDA